MVTTMNELRKVISAIVDIVKDTKEDIKTPLGELGRRMIKERTRQGRGVKNGQEISLEELLPSTKEIRRKYKKLSPETSPSKSNLTESGKLLDNMTLRETKNGVTIGTQRGSRNRDKAKYVQEKRPFMEFSEKEENKLAGFVTGALLKRLKKLC